MKKNEGTGWFKRLIDFWAKIPFARIFVLPFKKFFSFLSNWKHIIAIFIAGAFFLYYPIGAFVVHNIDKNVNVDVVNSNPNESNIINTLSYIINREVNEKMWTPNLPFIFPSYFLDNMPNFQLGMLSAVASFTDAFSQKFGPHDNLSKAAELLRYPGTTWVFSANNKLMPVPSANSQYRKARKHLLSFNNELANNTAAFNRTPENLAFLLGKANIDLAKSMRDIDTHVREVSSVWFDNKADDVFYYNQGKIYSYYLILKSVGYDYKDLIIENNLYQEWVKMLKALEGGISLTPLMIRNGQLDSIASPNHINYLGYFVLKAQNSMQKIVIKLDKNRKKTNDDRNT